MKTVINKDYLQLDELNENQMSNTDLRRENTFQEWRGNHFEPSTSNISQWALKCDDRYSQAMDAVNLLTPDLLKDLLYRR